MEREIKTSFSVPPQFVLIVRHGEMHRVLLPPVGGTPATNDVMLLPVKKTHLLKKS